MTDNKVREAATEVIKHARAFSKVLNDDNCSCEVELDIENALKQAVNKLDEVLSAASQPAPPVVEMQQLIDAGFNAFGLQLFAESVANIRGKSDNKTFEPFTFKFRNIKITLAPDGEVDTRHH